MLREHETLLTVADVAERFGQHPDTIRRKARDGEIPALKLGTGPRARFAFDRHELEAWVYGLPESAAGFAPFRARATPAERGDVPGNRAVDGAPALAEEER
jgi:excisionase family DNA binding protein